MSTFMVRTMRHVIFRDAAHFSKLCFCKLVLTYLLANSAVYHINIVCFQTDAFTPLACITSVLLEFSVNWVLKRYG